MVSKGKNKAGAPDKKTRQKNKGDRTKAKLVDEILKADELIVENYLDSVELLISAMKGEMKGCSPTNQLSSGKLIKVWAEEIMERSEKDTLDVDNPTSEKEELPEKKLAPLISLTPVKTGTDE